MAYNALDSAKPNASEDGVDVPGSANVNDLALWDAGLMLAAKSFEWSITAGTGTAQRPQYVFLKNGTRWIRATITWGTTSGEKYNPTSILWELSTNSGGAYDTIATQAITYDSNGYPTATTGAGGFSVMLLSLLGHFWRHRDDYTTHAAATGTGVHGLGSISTQAANNVAITGGYAELAYLREAKNAVGNVSASTPVSWAAGGLATLTVTGASGALTWTNLPSGKVGYLTLEVVNGGVATALLPAGTKTVVGTPSWAVSGTNIAVLMCHDGSEVTLVGFGLKATI